MITPLPGITATKPGSATQPFPGVEAEVLDESERRADRGGPGAAGAHPPVAVDAAHPLQGGRALHRDLLQRFGKETYLVGDAARRDADGYFWVIGRIDDVVNVSGHRLSTAEVESAIVAHADVAEAAVIGQHDEDTGQAIVRVRDAAGRARGRRARRSRASARRSPSGSASSPAPSASSGPTTCPRRARARSCAGCCATSPRAARWATSRRCATPP